MKKNSFYTDHIFTRACISSDYSREKDQLDAIYVENWPLSLQAHMDVEYLNYLKVSVCVSVMKSVENVFLSLSVCIAEWGGQDFGPNTVLYGAAGLVLLWYQHDFVARETAKDLVVLGASNIKDGENLTTTFGKGSISKLEDDTSKTSLDC